MARSAPLDEATNAKIRKQVEFYFSDSNAPRDNFLMDKIRKHPEGYVELAILCSFTRMSKLLNLAPNQKAEEIPDAVIAKAAAALRSSEELNVSEDGLAVKRKLPLKPQTEALSEMDDRTVFVAPLPFDCTLEGLTEFFNIVAPVRCVRMRRSISTKDFRGSVFVEFHTKAMAEEVLKQKLVYEGAPLRLESKNAYMARKIAERKSKAGADPSSNDERPATADFSTPHNEQGGPGGRQDNGQSDDTHDRSANGGRKHPRIIWPAAGPSNGAAAGPSGADGSGEPAEPAYEKGLVIRFTIPEEVEVPVDLHYTVVKEAFGGRHGGIVFVEYQKGQRMGLLRVRDREQMTTVLEKLDENGTIELDTVRAGVEVIDGDEERDFHARALVPRVAADRTRRPGGGEFVVQRNNKRTGNFHGRGGSGRFGKRGRVF